MLSWLLSALLAAPQPAAWRPPPNPEPRAILNEARINARLGRSDVALAQLVWFHENALKIEPAMAGVRLSFALEAWSDLAKAYPPAMAALTRARDDALALLRADDPKSTFEAFSDLEAINQQLGQEPLTIEVFHDLDREHRRPPRESSTWRGGP